MPKRGFEPLLLAEADFLTTIVFTTLLLGLWSGLYLHHSISTLDVLCQVSTRSFSGFARYSHLKGFTEFTGFYIKDFSLSTQFSKSVVYTIPPPELTYIYYPIREGFATLPNIFMHPFPFHLKENTVPFSLQLF